MGSTLHSPWRSHRMAASVSTDSSPRSAALSSRTSHATSPDRGRAGFMPLIRAGHCPRVRAPLRRNHFSPPPRGFHGRHDQLREHPNLRSPRPPCSQRTGHVAVVQGIRCRCVHCRHRQCQVHHGGARTIRRSPPAAPARGKSYFVVIHVVSRPHDSGSHVNVRPRSQHSPSSAYEVEQTKLQLGKSVMFEPVPQCTTRRRTIPRASNDSSSRLRPRTNASASLS